MVCETPILLITWRRPDTTRMVLDQVCKARPRTLIVTSDGPSNSGDIEKIEETRALFDDLPWECEVIRHYSEFNMGLAWRITSAVDFAFRHCEQLIVLEDDILAHESFFPYCEDLLDYYRDNERVMWIRGTSNNQVKQFPTPASYLFTRITSPWGWATWKRAWTGHDHSFFASDKARFLNRHPLLHQLRNSMKHIPYWPKINRNPELRERLASCGDRYAFWLEQCDRRLQLRSWAGLFAIWLLENDGVVVTPRANLTQNIGFRADAINTRPDARIPQSMKVEAMPLPLVHPTEVLVEAELQRQIAAEIDRTWTKNRRVLFRRFRTGT
jgi:hypothetical protein